MAFVCFGRGVDLERTENIMETVKHPCNICNHSDDCDINCVFYRSNEAYCENYNCIYHNSNISCQFGCRCGSYIGTKKSDLVFFEENFEE